MLGDVLAEFTSRIQAGMLAIKPYSTGLLASLLAINIIIFGYKIAIGQYNDISSIVWQFFIMAFLVYLVKNFDKIAIQFNASLLELGLKTQDNYTSVTITKPDSIIKYAWDKIIVPLGTKILETKLQFNMNSLLVLTTYAVTFIIVMLCFILISVHIILAFIEFYLVVMFSLILIPFIIFEPTKFIGTKPLGAVVGSALKIGILAALTGVIIAVFNTVVTSPVSEIPLFNPNTMPPGASTGSLAEEMTKVAPIWMLKLIVVSLICIYLVVQVPGLVAAVLTGTPSLSPGGAYRGLGALVVGTTAAMRLGTAPIRWAKKKGQQTAAAMATGGASAAAGAIGGLAGGTSRMLKGGKDSSSSKLPSLPDSEASASNQYFKTGR